MHAFGPRHRVTTPEIFRDGDRWCLSYAGSDRSIRDGLHSQVGVARVSVLP